MKNKTIYVSVCMDHSAMKMRNRFRPYLERFDTMVEKQTLSEL